MLSIKNVTCLAPKSGFHNITYYEWIREDQPSYEINESHVVVCVHGLTQNARFFDFLSKQLLEENERIVKVVCVDIPGRGQSDYLTDSSEYHDGTYITDLMVVLARAILPDQNVHYIGTSLGAILGMNLASYAQCPIKSFVFNDLGAVVPKAAIERIASYLGKTPKFDNFEQVISYLRQVYAPCGPLSEDQWQHLGLFCSRKIDGDKYEIHYDQKIADNARLAPPQDVNRFAIWDKIKAPVLLIRGTRSDLFLKETLLEMKTRGPKFDIVEFDVGHAPYLMDPEQIKPIIEWLNRHAK